jgi:hypothetical protein
MPDAPARAGASGMSDSVAGRLLGGRLGSLAKHDSALPPGQIVGGHFPSTYVASESPGQDGMETQMNVRSASPVFRY